MSEDSFDPGGVGVHNGNYFGFPWQPEECDVVIVNVPWDATTSYRRGTAKGPEAMVAASTQLDFYSFDNPGTPLLRCGTDNTLHAEVFALNQQAGQISAEVIEKLEMGISQEEPLLREMTAEVNSLSKKMTRIVYERCRFWLNKGKRVIVAGGEHSVPLGYLQALAEVHPSFGILQIDAHADLRVAYEGFEQSHASIMYNALQISQVKKLTQVCIRDVSHAEMTLAEHDPRVSLFSDHSLNKHLFAGGNWFELCRDIVGTLPDKVYLSFDIDGLEPSCCPHTGTPVPGGISLDAAMYLIRMVAESGRVIIGADLCEVAPGADEWDASNGARVLYRTAVLMQHSYQPTIA